MVLVLCVLVVCVSHSSFLLQAAHCDWKHFKWECFWSKMVEISIVYLREACRWKYIWNALIYQTHAISQRAESFTEHWTLNSELADCTASFPELHHFWSSRAAFLHLLLETPAVWLDFCGGSDNLWCTGVFPTAATVIWSLQYPPYNPNSIKVWTLW